MEKQNTKPGWLVCYFKPLKQIKVNLEDRSYCIKIGENITNELFKLNLNCDFVIISCAILQKTLRPIKEHFKKNNIRYSTVYLEEGEKAKSLSVFSSVLNKLFKFEKQKKICLLAVGGGVIGDIVGFVASVYKRGIPYLQIPTTLLASVDSSVGGKTAIDLPWGKNLIGSFYQPKLVLIDILNLKTLPLREIKSGLAEVVKYGVIISPPLFQYLEKNYSRILTLNSASLEKIILECVKIKTKLVEADEKDTHRKRIILNCGHTIAHSIETTFDYSNIYNHGEAVALGLLIEAEISYHLNYISREDVERIKALLLKIGLPTKIKKVSLSKLFAAMRFDKKFTSGKNKFALPSGIGSVKIVEEVPREIIKKALRCYEL